MKTSLISAPSVEPVTLAEMKTHSRVDISDDDTYISSIISAARNHVEQVTGRRLITQTWDYYLDAWPEKEIALPFGNVQSVTSVKYTDTDGNQTTWATSEYDVDAISDPGRVVLAYGKSWPSDALDTTNPIVVRYNCGYGDAGSDCPEAIIQAIKFLAAHFFENRESVTVGVSIKETPQAVDYLLSPFRLWWSF